jgi:hypothetical protein
MAGFPAIFILLINYLESALAFFAFFAFLAGLAALSVLAWADAAGAAVVAAAGASAASAVNETAAKDAAIRVARTLLILNILIRLV